MTPVPWQFTAGPTPPFLSLRIKRTQNLSQTGSPLRAGASFPGALTRTITTSLMSMQTIWRSTVRYFCFMLISVSAVLTVTASQSVQNLESPLIMSTSSADYTGLHLPWANMSWTADASLQFMESLGIEMAVLSISTPGIPFGPPEEVRDIARKVITRNLPVCTPCNPSWSLSNSPADVSITLRSKAADPHLSNRDWTR